ncbi:zinc finger, C2H2 type [Oesophagostomum dentatum]|uniref:Zinc finger, C2H2 type n=1 Tax=Oesophagostomum dentatum TaxID=61180 RepID=A0A0B1T064_OESDE|nr:zinc finger, C2H2 type [Oesophagostomum dentatum]
MAEYPVVFRCSECTIEQPTLELLESHIWSRHLHNFPFSCAVCGFPAIAHSSLAAHYKQAHSPDQPVEFQRKMHDEVRLRDIIANSIVVPVYEEEEIYEQEPQQATQSELQSREMDMKNLDSQVRQSESEPISVAEAEQPLEVIDVSQGEEQLQLSVVNDTNAPVGMPLLEQDVSMENGMMGDLEMYVEGDGRYQKVGMYQNVEDGLDIAVVEDQEILDEQHMSRGTQMVHIAEDGATYEIYEGDGEGEILVEGAPYEYQTVDGQNVYIEDTTASGSKSASDVRMRLAKQRHIEFVVNKVARRSNGRLKRPLTIYECERPYHCTWDCGKSFHSNSALKMHERTHK